ncbi:MAG TPA: glycosyltransferase, partial [Puia sp.]|nr:glycosyltransferase [Puia sp.]
MKIVHVIPFFLPDTVAGTEVYCWSLCKYLQRQGVEVEVLIPGYGLNENVEYTYDGIHVVKYAEPTVQTRLHIAGLAEPVGIVAFTNYLRQFKPDIVHFHGIYGGIGITVGHMEAARRSGFHTAYTIHLPGDTCRTQTLVYKDRELCDGIIRPVRCAACSLVHQTKTSSSGANVLAFISGCLQKIGMDTASWENTLGTALSSANRIVDIRNNLDRLADSCDRMVFYAKWFRKMIVANGFPARKTEYIPPALSYAAEGPVSPAPIGFQRKDSIKIVFIGRIHLAKGVYLMLEALQGLPAEKIELSIYGKSGDDSYYRSCQELSAAMENVHWRGLLPREQLLPSLRQHDILCLPSAFSEMSPLVIQEAFAAGIPVLASEVYGNAEQVTHNENGLLFPFKSMTGLRDQLRRIVEEKDLLPGLKSRVAAPPSFDEAGEKYLSLYNQII